MCVLVDSRAQFLGLHWFGEGYVSFRDGLLGVSGKIKVPSEQCLGSSGKAIKAVLRRKTRV